MKVINQNRLIILHHTYIKNLRIGSNNRSKSLELAIAVDSTIFGYASLDLYTFISILTNARRSFDFVN
jgi:hypothetical protein